MSDCQMARDTLEPSRSYTRSHAHFPKLGRKVRYLRNSSSLHLFSFVVLGKMVCMDGVTADPGLISVSMPASLFDLAVPRIRVLRSVSRPGPEGPRLPYDAHDQNSSASADSGSLSATFRILSKKNSTANFYRTLCSSLAPTTRVFSITSTSNQN